MKTETNTVNWEDQLNGLNDGYADHKSAFLLWLIENNEIDMEDYKDFDNPLEEALSDVMKTDFGSYEHNMATGEYLILTDDEADEAARESLENYIDECVMSEIPEIHQKYFDTERFIEDAISIDGRGHTLSSYDGVEHEVSFNDDSFFIYRTN